MDKLTNSSLAAIQNYTYIDDTEEVNSFNGFILCSPQQGRRYEQTTFTIIVFNTSIQVRMVIPGEILKINKLIPDIKEMICANSLNTSRWIFLTKEKFKAEDIIDNIERTNQITIDDGDFWSINSLISIKMGKNGFVGFVGDFRDSDFEVYNNRPNNYFENDFELIDFCHFGNN